MLDLQKKKKIHFIGIGGIGMSSLARIMLDLGHKVFGSDRAQSSITDELVGKGASIYIGHSADNIGDAEVVIYSSAIKEENPELRAARDAGLAVLARSDLLAELMAPRKAITIAGTHGKTTTTALISIMLEKAGIDPTIMIGGQIKEIKGNSKLGKSEWFVAEADESDGSFLKYNPYMAVITNVEAEHLDFYGTEEKVIEAFKEFVTKVKPDGKIILCQDCPRSIRIRESATVPSITFGFNSKADLWPGEISIIGEQTNFNVYTKKGPLGRIRLQIPGHHNIMNALAAIAVGLEMDISFHDMQTSMASFSGVGRRFQRLGVYHGAPIIDDYAHAPAEVAATIAAARSFEPARVIAVFQPHLFSRTRLFAEEFAKALCGADQVYLAPIYPAREEPIPGVTSEIIADSIKRHDGPQVFYNDDIEIMKNNIKKSIRPGDYVLFMGAGDIWKIGSRLVTEED